MLKSARVKMQVTYREKPIRRAAGFSMKTFEAKRPWNNAFLALKDYDSQPRIIYPAKLSAIIERKRKTFMT